MTRYRTVIADEVLIGLANLLLRALWPNIENRTVAAVKNMRAASRRRRSPLLA
jgi:hypothetical protein